MSELTDQACDTICRLCGQGDSQRTTGNMERAADELMRAYMGLDDEAWLDEDPKYLDFLATVGKGLKTTAGKTVSYDADCLTRFSDGLNLGFKFHPLFIKRKPLMVYPQQAI